jgi:hypothetical protein
MDNRLSTTCTGWYEGTLQLHPVPMPPAPLKRRSGAIGAKVAGSMDDPSSSKYLVKSGGGGRGGGGEEGERRGGEKRGRSTL